MLVELYGGPLDGRTIDVDYSQAHCGLLVPVTPLHGAPMYRYIPRMANGHQVMSDYARIPQMQWEGMRNATV